VSPDREVMVSIVKRSSVRPSRGTLSAHECMFARCMRSIKSALRSQRTVDGTSAKADVTTLQRRHVRAKLGMDCVVSLFI
jgi:hypothetical protein